tara:strand:+ start:1148 stop:2206 length:1059 start_codon:yes stop_codon:yes gene_type:complete
MKNIKISRKSFNKENPLIIAEIGQAHEGSEGLAHSMIDALCEIGCDAIKFQIHLADSESSFEDQFRINFSYEDKSRYDYWKRIEFTELQWSRIIDHCKSKNIIVGASVFSIEALEIAKKNKVDFLKIGSGDILFEDLVNSVSNLELPVIISSGMANWDELNEISSKFISHKKKDLFSILHCTTQYPTEPEKIGYNNLKTIEEKLDVVSGLSDHSGNYLTAFYALARGCPILEVHVNFDRKMFGPDSTSSLSINELGEVIKAKNYFKKLSTITDKNKEEKYLASTKKKFARSIGIKKNIKKGDLIKKEDIIYRKPGGYLSKDDMKFVIGMRAKHDLNALNIIKWDDIEDEIKS